MKTFFAKHTQFASGMKILFLKLTAFRIFLNENIFLVEFIFVECMHLGWDG